MGPEGADGIKEGSTVMDLQPVRRIRVVAAPDLRRIVEHPCVIAAPTACAGLKKQIRIPANQPFHHIIHSQHMAVENLPLFSCLHSLGIHVSQSPVHVPFDIVCLTAVDHPEDLLHDIIPDFLFRHIEIQLRPASHRQPPRNSQTPVGMSAVKVAVLGHHLRFQPDTEFQSQLPDLFHKLWQAAVDLLLIDIPVSQTGVITVPLAEPAVIQHEHLQPYVFGSPGDTVKLLLIELKIGGLPVVDQNGPGLFHITAADEMFPEPVMEMMGKGLQAFAGIGHGRLGSRKGFPRL